MKNRRRLNEVPSDANPVCDCSLLIFCSSKRQFYATIALDKAEVASGDTLKIVERLIHYFDW